MRDFQNRADNKLKPDVMYREIYISDWLTDRRDN